MLTRADGTALYCTAFISDPDIDADGLVTTVWPNFVGPIHLHAVACSTREANDKAARFFLDGVKATIKKSRDLYDQSGVSSGGGLDSRWSEFHTLSMDGGVFANSLGDDAYLQE